MRKNSKVFFYLVMFFITLLIVGKGEIAKADDYVNDNEVVIGTHNLNNTANNSAKVGVSLKEPEKGWNRYDDTNSNIQYTGKWNHYKNFIAGCYKGTISECFEKDCEVNFSIVGSKIRIIEGGYGVDVSLFSNQKVFIDGVYVKDLSNILKIGDVNGYQRVVFEYIFSNSGKHDVKIVSTNVVVDYGSYSQIATPQVDAIDTDGRLVDAITPSTQLKPVLNVETPEVGKIYTGIMPVSGYALNPSGVKAVKIYLDDKYSKDATIGGARTDVAQKYQEYPGASTSGFSTSYSINNFTLGNHTMKVESVGNDGTIQAVMLYLYVFEDKIIVKSTPIKSDIIQYRAHVADQCWLPWVNNNEVAGTTGESRRMEAVQIQVNEAYCNYLHVEYRAHVADHGWLPWVRDGETAGTTGESRRMEAVEIRLVDNNGNVDKNYHVIYSAHVADYCWLPLVRDGEIAGTAGESRRMEALKLSVVG
jgi:uncharacterized protein YjdB